MSRQLVGYIKGSGYGIAGKRLKHCVLILNKHGFYFPPLFFGTINLVLEEDYITPEEHIFISQKEIDSIDPGFKEWWKLIPIKKVNGKPANGFIYRTQQNCHGNGVIELVTENLSGWDGVGLCPDSQIVVQVE